MNGECREGCGCDRPQTGGVVTNDKYILSRRREL